MKLTIDRDKERNKKERQYVQDKQKEKKWEKENKQYKGDRDRKKIWHRRKSEK